VLLDPLGLDDALSGNEDGTLDSALEFRDKFFATDVKICMVPDFVVGFKARIGDQDEVDLFL
jgi:hypothetical protein